MISHGFSFDPTYGYDESALRAIVPPAAPTDFAEFWKNTYKATMAVAPKPSLKPAKCNDKHWQVFEVDFTGLGNFRVGGWLVRPKHRVTGGFVVGHGYGGRGGPDNLSDLNAHTAYLFVCGRGFNRSARPDLPDKAEEHVVFNIDSRDNYLIHYCVADMWSATTALIELIPEVAHNIGYRGTSFGGGVGSLAVPWEPRWNKALLEVPTFGNHPVRLNIEMVGSGRSVRAYHQEHPEVENVLRYYDAATAMSFATTPCAFGLALFDPAVPPPGQWAVGNAHPKEKQIVPLKASHFGGYPGEADDQKNWRETVHQWEQKHHYE